MTAIALCYTKSGFVMAADGRSRTYDAATDVYSPDSDECQKIFSVVESGKILAYAVMGDAVSNQDGSFNLMAEVERQRKRLSAVRFDSLRDYVRIIGYKAKRAFDKAWKSGRLDPWQRGSDPNDEYDNLIARILFAGYAPNPAFVQAELFYDNRRAELRVSTLPIPPGIPALAAPTGILQIIDSDPRFAEYRKPYGPDISMEDACALIKGKIEACASPLAAEIDARCAGIGGHIHVAAVTPSGFRWLLPPKLGEAGF